VSPSDWAFTALQRLVEEYGCIEGYPDRTYRGNRAMTRYEFAAGLNACLDVIIQLLPELPQDQLDTILRLQEEFAAELATLRGRVDTLEADVAELEANQFSTTTKLKGQLDANLVVPFDAPSTAPGDEATFEYRARLNFDTSFTGEDRLRIRLQGRDGGQALSEFGGLAAAGGGGDNLALDDVYYSFPVGERISAIIAANSIVTDDFVTSTIVPFDGPAVADASGPVFYDQFAGGGTFGAGVNFALTENLILDLGYSTNDATNDATGSGLFDQNSYIAQLNYLSDGIIDAAVTYIGGEDGTADDAIAGLLSLDFGGFIIGGYYAAVDATAGGDLDTWQAGVAFPDFLGTGNQAGVYYATLPSTTATPYLIEGYYELDINEFLTITPALIYGDLDTAAGDDSGFYGAIRTTFSF
ncbi:MAG: iron uptake porin, partial [Cyanobacteria bacterium J06632_22]